MSHYHIEFMPGVLERMSEIPKNIQKRMMNAIEERLATAPDQYGTRLRQSLIGLWKLRVGDYRIAYNIEGDTVFIEAIAHRKNIYQQLGKKRK